MSSNYTYDGSWEGLLSAVFRAYREPDAAIHNPRDGVTMFAAVPVETSPEQAERLTRGMERLSPAMPMFVYRAFCAEYDGFETDLLESLRLGFRQNADPFWQRQLPYVRRVAEAETKTGREAHRFLGLVRFVNAGGNLYAGDIAPDCNILSLIGDHFYDRFNDQRIILRDTKRRTALISEPPNGWWITDLPDLPPLPENDAFTEMWKGYTVALANPERKNLKLQQNFVPLKHRKNMPEFRGP
ncbi:MAG: TIGR03915 family putative DNA repair protein [Oscillospiraceae bacterium]|nr:TIGR03915 family putative DNA repair protein [Oscillospiraceae bacterium]